MGSRRSLGDSIVSPAILENADDEEVEEINDSDIASFFDKYLTSSGRSSGGGGTTRKLPLRLEKFFLTVRVPNGVPSVNVSLQTPARSHTATC